MCSSEIKLLFLKKNLKKAQWQIHLGVVWNWLCQIHRNFLVASHISHRHNLLLKTETFIFLLFPLLPLRKIRFQVNTSEKKKKVKLV